MRGWGKAGRMREEEAVGKEEGEEENDQEGNRQN